MKNKLYIGITITIFLLPLIVLIFMAGDDNIIAQTVRYAKLDWPVIRGEASGTRLVYDMRIPAAEINAASVWAWGDTTAAGMYTPPTVLEILAVTIIWDPDAGDSIRVYLYSVNGSDVAEIVADSDTLLGSAYSEVDATITAAKKYITAAEGMSCHVELIAGTPGAVDLIIEAKNRNGDANE